MKSKVRSSFSWFLSILLVLTMMPAMALTASATTSSLNVGVVWTVNDETVDSIPVEYTNGGILTAEVVGGESTYTYAWYETTTEVADLDAFEALNPQELTNSNVNKWIYNVGDSLTVGPHYFVCKVTDNTETSLVGIGKATVTVAPAAPTAVTVAKATGFADTLTYGSIGSVEADNRKLTVEATGATDYQWYTSTTDNGDGTVIDGATTADYIIPTDATAGTLYYYCEATKVDSGSGISSAPTVSNRVEVTVEKRSVGTLEWTTPATFTYNGEDQSPTVKSISNLVEGDTVSFTYTYTNGESQVVGNNADVGSYIATAALSDGTAEGDDSENYTTEGVAVLTQTFTITAKDLTFTPKDQVATSADTIAKSESQVEVVGLIEGHTITFGEGFSLTGDVNAGETEGTITLEYTPSNVIIKDSASTPQTVTTNYNVPDAATGTGKLTIVEAQASPLSGVVYSNGGSNGLGGIKVTLEKGDLTYGEVTTENDGSFSFATAEPDIYNVVARDTASGLTMTKLVDLSTTPTCDIEMPPENTNSKLNNDAAGDLAPVVGGLDKVALALHNANQGQTVTATLTVTDADHITGMTAERQEEFTEGKAKISADFLSDSSKIRGEPTFFDMALTATLDGVTSDYGDANDQVLDVYVPYQPVTGGDGVQVYRYHVDEDGAVYCEPMYDLTNATIIGTNQEGFVASDDNVRIRSKNYSVFAIVTLAAANNDQPAGGGGGGGRTSGGNAATTPDTPATTEPTTTEPVTTNPTTGTSTTTFTDVKEGAYYAEAVKWAVAAGITNGKTATLFGPDDSCTRAQIVTFIWRAMGSPEPTVSSTAFTDIDAAAYYYKAVLWAVEAGVANGTSATTFSPNATVTRGEAVTFLYRAKGGSLATASTQFTDVDPSAYYAEAVAWAAANGITTGTSATTFSPNEKCTRGQIVTFLYRANN